MTCLLTGRKFVNVPLKRVVVDPFTRPTDKHDGPTDRHDSPVTDSTEPTLLILQSGQKYFYPAQSYVTDD